MTGVPEGETADENKPDSEGVDKTGRNFPRFWRRNLAKLLASLSLKVGKEYAHSAPPQPFIPVKAWILGLRDGAYASAPPQDDESVWARG